MKKNIIRSLIMSSMFFLVAVIFISCNEEKTYAKEFNIDNIDFNKWDNLLKVERITQLKENDSCLMSYASKCIITDSIIIFQDYKAKRIYSFANDGTFLCQIGNIGHSASEYTSIVDIFMNKGDSLLMVLDERGIACYRPIKGEFVSRKKFFESNASEYDKAIQVDENKYLCLTTSDNSNSIVLDSPQGQTGLRKSKRFHFVTELFYKTEGKYRVVSDYGDFYIDSYENGELKPLYKINLGSEALPGNILPQTFEEFEAVDKSPKYFKCITDAHETSEWLFIQTVGPNQEYYIGFINKNDGTYAFGKIKDLGSMAFIGATSDYFYAIVYPEFALPDTFAEKVVKQYGGGNEKKTPMIVKVKVKNV